MTETIIDWQPISTAPRDGKPFLAWCSETGKQGVDMARWSNPHDPKDRIGHFKTRYGWIPTHWAPMPKAPENVPYSPRFFQNSVV